MNGKIVRAVIWLAMACVGFAGGSVYFRGGDWGVVEKRQRSLQEWAAGQPSAVITGVAGEEMDEVDRVQKQTRGNLAGEMLGYFQLIHETPVGELGELMLRFEKRLARSQGGGMDAMVGKVILERMLEEDPDGLLAFAVSGRSHYVENSLGRVMGSLLERRGYDSIAAELSESEYPERAAKAMGALFMSELWNGNEELTWQRVLEFGRVALGGLVVGQFGEEVVDLIADPSTARRFDSKSVANVFSYHWVEDAERAVRIALELPNVGQRASALRGVGKLWVRDDFSAAREFAERLESDQMRLAFYEDSLLSDEGDAIFGGDDYPESFLKQIQELDAGYVRETLTARELATWKGESAEKAREWAEASDQLELFERLDATQPRWIE